MSAAVLASYLGLAALYGVAAAAVLWSGLRLAGVPVDGRHALTLGLACVFLALTQHPLPDPATMDCTGGGPEPILRPFAVFDHLSRIWRRSMRHGFAAHLWFGNQVVQAALVNFGLCAAVGAALARHMAGARPWLAALGIGVLLSGGAELAQLTGLFGLYPCAWRTFEVDDLILNIGGLMAGFALMRQVRARN